jgi:hypothetical protein
MEKVVTYRPIGVIHTPFKDIVGMPIQPPGARGVASFRHQTLCPSV